MSCTLVGAQCSDVGHLVITKQIADSIRNIHSLTCDAEALSMLSQLDNISSCPMSYTKRVCQQHQSNHILEMLYHSIKHAATIVQKLLN